MKLLNILLTLSFVMVTGCAAFDHRSQESTTNKDTTEQNLIAKKPTTSASVGEPKRRILVLPFLVEVAGAPAEVNREAQEEFVHDLNKSGQVLAINSDDMQSIKAPLKDNGYDFKTLAAEGGKLGVSVFLEGKILDIKSQKTSPSVGLFRSVTTKYVCKVGIRMGSARSGKELFNTIKTVTLSEDSTRIGDSPRWDDKGQNSELVKQIIKDAFSEFLPQIIEVVERQNWEGRIAAIQGERIFLNVGSVSGLQIGDLLKVMDEGQEVYDPETGAFIGQVPGKLKGTLEVISFFGQDASIAIIHSGAGFKENDRVELY